MVRLVGDGLYLESLTGLPGAGDDAALVTLLEQLARTPSPQASHDAQDPVPGGPGPDRHMTPGR